MAPREPSDTLLPEDDQKGNRMDTANTIGTGKLQLTDSLRTALDHALADARSCLERDGAMTPFSIICTSDGYEVSDHVGDDVDAIYESARTLVAREMPEAYVFGYDGFVETAAGRREAVIVELARRGDGEARLLALIYDLEDGAYSFADDPVLVGAAETLYPAGTRPIVSGLVELARERAAAAEGEE